MAVDVFERVLLAIVGGHQPLDHAVCRAGWPCAAIYQIVPSVRSLLDVARHVADGLADADLGEQACSIIDINKASCCCSPIQSFKGRRADGLAAAFTSKPCSTFTALMPISSTM
jgi:hypothetical protein